MTSDPRPQSLTSERLRVAVIGACYYTAPARFAALAAAFVRELLPDGFAVEQCFVDMRSPSAAARQGMATSWIGSTGRYLDISAYAGAAEVVGDHDLCLVLNDTLFTKHPWRLAARRLRALIPTLTAFAEPAAAGEVHASTDLLLLDVRNPTRRHLSTFCFLLNRAGFTVFRELAQTLPEDGSSRGISAWLDAQAHPPLKHLLHVHLTGPVSPWSWNGRLHQGAADDLVLRKAVTVAFEYLLSEQILRRGGVILPINVGLKYRVRAKAAALYSRIGRK